MLLIRISPALHAGSVGITQCSAQVVNLKGTQLKIIIALLPFSGQFIVNEVPAVHPVLCLVVTRIEHSTKLSSYAKHATASITFAVAVGEGLLSVIAKVT